MKQLTKLRQNLNSLMHFDDGIFVAGHNGMVGSAITRKLNSLGYRNIITKNRKDLEDALLTSIAGISAAMKNTG